MYSTIFQSRRIRIKDDHLEQLLERFDYRKFKLNENLCPPAGPKMQNNVPCILCRSFNPRGRGCVGCPLGEFKTSVYTGCVAAIVKLVSNNSPLHTFIGSVVYRTSSKTQAVKDLKTITKVLKSFKKEKSR